MKDVIVGEPVDTGTCKNVGGNRTETLNFGGVTAPAESNTPFYILEFRLQF